MSVWLPTDDDESILAIMTTANIVITPKVLAFETDIKYSRIRHRLRELTEHGYIERPPEAPDDVSRNGVYQITDLGRQYHSGDITINELRNRSEQTA